MEENSISKKSMLLLFLKNAHNKIMSEVLRKLGKDKLSPRLQNKNSVFENISFSAILLGKALEIESLDQTFRKGVLLAGALEDICQEIEKAENKEGLFSDLQPEKCLLIMAVLLLDGSRGANDLAENLFELNLFLKNVEFNQLAHHALMYSMIYLFKLADKKEIMRGTAFEDLYARRVGLKQPQTSASFWPSKDNSDHTSICLNLEEEDPYKILAFHKNKNISAIIKKISPESKLPSPLTYTEVSIFTPALQRTILHTLRDFLTLENLSKEDPSAARPWFPDFACALSQCFDAFANLYKLEFNSYLSSIELEVNHRKKDNLDRYLTLMTQPNANNKKKDALLESLPYLGSYIPKSMVRARFLQQILNMFTLHCL